jgi:hypothetical protein
MNITFNSPVQNLQFSIYDIDNNDIVTIEGSSSPTLTAETSSPSFQIVGNSAISSAGENLGSSNTTLNVEFNEPVSSVSITLEEGNAITAYQWIGISDMRMCVPDVFSEGGMCSSNTRTLDWTNINYDPNEVPTPQTFAIMDQLGGNVVDVQLIWSGDVNSLTRNTDNNDPGFFKDQKGMIATDDGLEILADPTSSGSTVSLTVNFFEPGTTTPATVLDLRFSIYDIDNSITPGGFNPRDRRDKVTLSGSPLLEADSEGSTFGIYGNMIIGATETHADGNDGDGGEVGATESSAITGRGTVNVFYPGNISSFTLDYTEAHTFAANPSLRGIELSDFNFCSLILPIDLMSFKGEKQDNMLELTWATMSETNNDYFEIYHSIDGRSFQPIAQMNGKGNSSTLLNYSYMHKKPNSGINYYKLKQTDFDGQYSESEIISVYFDPSDKNWNLYPNPTSGRVFIDTNSKTTNVKVLNTLGVKIIDTFENVIDISNYPAGTYYIQIFENGTLAETKKLLKQ